MGLETALAISAGSSILGGILQAREGSRLRNQASNIAGNGNQDIMSLIQGYLGQQRQNGPDPFGTYLRTNPAALAPYSFDLSKAYQGYQAQDKMNLTDALSTLSAGAGSLGARFGTGFAGKQAVLQSRFLADQGARNAGIAQSSFNTALGAAQSAFGNTQSQQTGLLSLLLSARNSGVQNQLAALGVGAGAPTPGQIVSGVGGGIGSLAFLLPFLRDMGSQTGAGPVIPAGVPSPNTYAQGIRYQPVNYYGGNP